MNDVSTQNTNRPEQFLQCIFLSASVPFTQQIGSLTPGSNLPLGFGTIVVRLGTVQYRV